MNTRKIKTVIFDIDDTLYDFTTANAAALGAVSAYAREMFGWDSGTFEEKYRSTQKEVIDRLGFNGSCRNRVLRYQRMLEKEGLPLSPHVIRMYETYWDTLLGCIRPFDDAADTLRALKELNLRIGCGTDMTALMQFRKLDSLGLLPYIDFLVSSEEAGAEKPDRRVFDLCVEKAGCMPEECLFIGDNIKKDYFGAVNAGMHAIWYNPAQESISEDVCSTGKLSGVLGFLQDMGIRP